MKRITTLTVLLLAMTVFAEGVQLKLPAEVKGEPGAFVKVTAETNGKLVKWKALDRGLALFPVDLLKDTKTAVVTAVKPGKYRLQAVTALADEPSDIIETVVVVGNPTPPTPPTPPKPPEPTPSPAPIPVEGFRVLMIYESADLSKLPIAQQSVLFSRPLRDYLNSKCVMGPDNKTKEWRIYDKDTDVTGESKLWQDAMKRERKSLPWVIISTGKSGYEGPMPENTEKTLELLKKYGGA